MAEPSKAAMDAAADHRRYLFERGYAAISPQAERHLAEIIDKHMAAEFPYDYAELELRAELQAENAKLREFVKEWDKAIRQFEDGFVAFDPVRDARALLGEK